MTRRRQDRPRVHGRASHGGYRMAAKLYHPSIRGLHLVRVGLLRCWCSSLEPARATRQAVTSVVTLQCTVSRRSVLVHPTVPTPLSVTVGTITYRKRCDPSVIRTNGNVTTLRGTPAPRTAGDGASAELDTRQLVAPSHNLFAYAPLIDHGREGSGSACSSGHEPSQMQHIQDIVSTF